MGPAGSIIPKGTHKEEQELEASSPPRSGPSERKTLPCSVYLSSLDTWYWTSSSEEKAGVR